MVVTHGGVIASLVSIFNKINGVDDKSGDISNTSINTFQITIEYPNNEIKY